MRPLFGFLTVACAALFLCWGGVRIYDYVHFDIHCGQYLKRAADSNSVELAEQNLSTVVDYARDNGLTSGNTGILWNSPSNDVGFWYTNITTSLNELRHVIAQRDATDLERSNVLMKLEKTMLDQGKGSSSVVAPDGISIFPNNVAFCWWGWLSLIFMCLFGFCTVFANDD